MILVLGLGNPGARYERTRHNAGFMVLDEFQKQHAFPEFQESAKHKVKVSEGMVGEEKVILAKPTTFMNSSGKAVASLTKLSFPQLNLVKELVVVHDEIDLPIGEVKVSKDSGSAGHKGVDSVIQSLGTKDFHRVRIGIQPTTGKPENVESFVLKPFAKEEQDALKESIVDAVSSVESFIGQ